MMKRSLLLPFVLLLCLICACSLLAMTYSRMVQAEQMLESIYQSELSEACEQLSALRLSLDKLRMAPDAPQQAELLTQVSRLSSAVQDHLSALPASPQTLAASIAVMDALSSQAEAMLVSLTRDGALSSAQSSALYSALADCTLLSGQLSLARQAAASQQLALYQPGLAATLSLTSLADASDVPMIGHEVPLGLTGAYVTQEEAMTIAAQIVGEGRVQRVAAAASTGGALPAHGVAVDTPDLRLNLEITAQGGHLLWMMPETASFSATQSTDTCQQAAEAFLASQGYTAMVQTAWQQYDGLYVASYSPVQDGVLLYPDLLHVQVRMDTAEVVGFEADGYLTHHTTRTLSLPLVTSDEARAMVEEHAEVEDVRLCLLRIGQQETLCHQVSAISEGERYLVFIHALTGQTVTVQKLIVDENGVQVA